MSIIDQLNDYAPFPASIRPGVKYLHDLVDMTTGVFRGRWGVL